MSINQADANLRSILLYPHENASRWCEFWHGLSALWASGAVAAESMAEPSWLAEKANQFQITSEEMNALEQVLHTDVRLLCDMLESISMNYSNAHELERYRDQLVAQDGQWKWNEEHQRYGRFVRGVWEWQPEASDGVGEWVWDATRLRYRRFVDGQWEWQPEADEGSGEPSVVDASHAHLEPLVLAVAEELGAITGLRRAAPAERRELLALALARTVATHTERN